MKLKYTIDDATVELLGGATIEVSWGDLRSACHARDLRALIEVAYRKRRYVLLRSHESYIADILPEYEHEVWVWARAMVERLLEVTNVPHVMTRAFAATWAEWMLAGAVDDMGIYLVAGFGTRESYGYIALMSRDFVGDQLGWETTHELVVDAQYDPIGWGVRWCNGYD